MPWYKVVLRQTRTEIRSEEQVVAVEALTAVELELRLSEVYAQAQDGPWNGDSISDTVDEDADEHEVVAEIAEEDIEEECCAERIVLGERMKESR